MSMKSAPWWLAACVVAVVLSRSTGQARAQDDWGPLGVDFGVLGPATEGAAFPCEVRVRSLMTGEGVLLEKFSAAPGKETTFKKSSNGLDVDADVTIAPGGASVLYHISISTTAHKPLGIYSALLKLHS
jgi:hypothetical protein